MATFGELLKKYRVGSTDPLTRRPVTQGQVGDLIGSSHATISYWEKGIRQPKSEDRPHLIIIIEFFIKNGGCHSIDEANKLFVAGNYLALQPDEVERIQESLETRRIRPRSAKSLKPPVQLQPQTLDDLSKARLAPYVRPEILNQISSRMLRDEKEEILYDSLVQLLLLLLTYIPRHLALELINNPVPTQNQVGGEFLEGTLLFTDIHGFTKLTESLKIDGDEDSAEKIVALLNQYLDSMLGVLFKYSGRLIKFGGDSMLCLFGGKNNSQSAIFAAFEMQEEMRKSFAGIEIAQQLFSLNMKVGQHFGQLFQATVGNEDHLEYLLIGETVERTAQAESLAKQDEIIISQATYDLVKEYVQTQSVQNHAGYYYAISTTSEQKFIQTGDWQSVLEKVDQHVIDASAALIRLEAISPYLPFGLLNYLALNPSNYEIQGQYRQITILFVNFVGIGDLIKDKKDDLSQENIDQIFQLLQDYYLMIQDEVVYYGGVINKIDLYDHGDKLMIVFGAPIAHEQDARRAVLAALAFQKGLTQLKLNSLTADFYLSHRIGIHTGRAFAGNLGSIIQKRAEYTVMGDTVNMAARLMSTADFGEIVISDAVKGELTADFEVSNKETRHLKGFGNPVNIYRSVTHAGQIDFFHRPIRVHSPIVGRDSELNILKTKIEELESGIGKQILGVIGESGVGKSRLILECESLSQSEAFSSDFKWLKARGYAFGQRTNGLIIELLESLIKVDSLPKKKTLENQPINWFALSDYVKSLIDNKLDFEWFNDCLAYLGSLLGLDLEVKPGLVSKITGIDGQTILLKTAHVLVDILIRESSKHPIIIYLDDLHWADLASLNMVKELVARFDDFAQVLFIFNFREANWSRVSQFWQEIERDYRGYCDQIEIKELNKNDGHSVIRNALGNGLNTSQKILEHIRTETDGNPLYIEEMVLFLQERGLLAEGHDDQHKVYQAIRFGTPRSLQQIIQSRIDYLDMTSPGARRLLWMAAVLGTQFTNESLLSLCAEIGQSYDDYKEHLRLLQNSAIFDRAIISVGEQTSSGYQFRHGLVQQVAYQNMPSKIRHSYHLHIGMWMENILEENIFAYFGVLGNHFEKGKSWEKAFNYYLNAGRRDARVYALEDAIAYFQKAISLLSHVISTSEEIGDIRFELAELLKLFGNYSAAQTELDQAELLWQGEAQRASVRLKRARLKYELGRIYEELSGQTNFENALSLKEEGIGLLGDSLVETEEAAMLYALGGLVNLRMGRMAEAVIDCQSSLSVAQAVGHSPIHGFVNRLMSMISRHQGSPVEALNYIDSAIIVDENNENLVGLAKGYSNKGVYAFELGDWQAADIAYRKAIDVLEKTGDRYQLAMTLSNWADLHMHKGDIQRGLENAQLGLSIFKKIVSFQGEVFALIVIATLYLKMTKYSQAIIELEKAAELIEEQKIEEFRPTLTRWRAEVYLALNQLDQVTKEIETIQELSVEVLDLEYEPIQLLRAQVLANQGDVSAAHQIVQESLARASDDEDQYLMGRCHFVLSLIYHTTDQNLP